MALRRVLALKSRIRESDIEGLRCAVLAGVPWENVAAFDRVKGRSDLIFLVRAQFYVAEFIESANDTEAAIEIWSALREGILEQHARYQPGSRPWAWWGLEDRPPRRRLTTACNCIELPDHSGGKFPPANLSFFGRPRFCACAYEPERDYLSRLKLLTEREKLSQAVPDENGD